MTIGISSPARLFYPLTLKAKEAQNITLQRDGQLVRKIADFRSVFSVENDFCVEIINLNPWCLTLLLLSIQFFAISYGILVKERTDFNNTLENFTEASSGGKARPKRNVPFVEVVVTENDAKMWYGQQQIVPQFGQQLVFDASFLTEASMNKIFENVAYMQCCIVVKESSYQSLRFPQLRGFESCRPGRPAIEIVRNEVFSELYLPMGLEYPVSGTPVVVELNRLVPTLVLSPIGLACPKCRVTSDIACGLMGREYTQIELIEACAGKEIIRPPQGYTIELDSTTVTEEQLNAMCANAVHIEACITISQSRFQSLRCPKLQYLYPCRADKPAITIVGNPDFNRLEIPQNVHFLKRGTVIMIKENPHLNWDIIAGIQPVCPNCILNAGDVNTMKSSYKQWIGSIRIEPQPGSMLVFESSVIPEKEMNSIFENVVYMKACVNIINSDYTSFRIPNLIKMESCRPDRPAIVVMNNIRLQNFYLPSDIIYPSNTDVPPMIISNTPLVPYNVLSGYAQNCENCNVLDDIACGLQQRRYRFAELIRACAGTAVVKPAPGYIIDITSSYTNEYELNALCSNAIYMEICITIEKSNIHSLRCPRLQMLVPCEPGRAAIRIVNNLYFNDFYLPPNVDLSLREPESAVIEFGMNPKFPDWKLDLLRQSYTNYILIVDEIACGLGSKPFTLGDLVRACGGKEIIRPAHGSMLEIDAAQVAEADMNALCSNARYMEVCITIRKSSYRSLRCPKLRELKSCSPDRPAFTIVDNMFLEYIQIPNDVVYESYGVPMIISGNPYIQGQMLSPLTTQCPNCVITSPINILTASQLKSLYGEQVIAQPDGTNWYLDANLIPEQVMNDLFANAVYIKMCIVVVNSNYRTLRFPSLRQLVPCSPDRPALIVVNNPQLVDFYLPPNVKYPSNGVPLIVMNNMFLPQQSLQHAIQSCTTCNLDKDIGCGLGYKRYTHAELVTACAGKAYIRPAPGFIIELDSDYISDSQMNAVCKNAIYMEVCINIHHSTYQSLSCPKLQVLKPCEPGRMAIRIVENEQFSLLNIPPGIQFDVNEKPFYIKTNPRIPSSVLQMLQIACPNCEITGDFACGLVRGSYTELQLAEQCAGKTIIRPLPGSAIVFDARKISEAQMNALCAEVVYMEACIVIRKTNYKSLRCPKLRTLKSCRPDQPAITIMENLEFRELEISPLVTYPKDGMPLMVTCNPNLPAPMLQLIRDRCTNCITATVEVIPDELEASKYFRLVRIEPEPGQMLILHSSHLPEVAMNQICQNAVYMKACVVITKSSYKSLHCPKLQVIDPCSPDRPVFHVFDNPFLVEIYLPPSLTFPTLGTPLILEINQQLPPEELIEYQTRCPNCDVTSDIACGLGIRKYSVPELIESCRKKAIIRPAPGQKIILDGSMITEEQANDLCANAVYMEICITITNTQFKSLRCPLLKMLVPCEPGVPALKIVNNPLFHNLYIPADVIYPSTGAAIYIELNPEIPTNTLAALQQSCPQCHLLNDIGCGLGRGHRTANEILHACMGKEIIRPATGFNIVIDSTMATEAEFNALCANAVYMEACIRISDTKFTSLRCPKLKILKSCRPDFPAIMLFNNQQLTEFVLPEYVELSPDGVPLVILYNSLPADQLAALQQQCTNCITRSREAVVTAEQVTQFFGLERIESAFDVMLVFNSERLSETQMNLVCERATYIKACFVITNTAYRSFRCPHLQVLESCSPDRPALYVFDNILLQDFYIPPTTIYPETGVPVIIEIAPLVKTEVLQSIVDRCPRCRVMGDIVCSLNRQRYTVEELATACMYKPVIKPAPGFKIELDSLTVSEDIMNALCANAIYIEACITIRESTYKSLNCPHLRKLVSCDPERPALLINDNPFLQQFYIPPNVELPVQGVPIRLELNPLLPTSYLLTLQEHCPHCEITHDIECGLAGTQYSVEQFLQACANKRIIRPGFGKKIELYASDISEQTMNALCAKAEYMEVCITIKRSTYKSLLCPNLKVLRSCKPDHPALVIVDNVQFDRLLLPDHFALPEIGAPILMYNNSLQHTQLQPLLQLCPGCIIPQTQYVVMPDSASQFFGLSQIVPRPGQTLIFDSYFLSEKVMMRIFEKAEYIEACIVVANSRYTSLRFDRLRKIKSCSPERPAIHLYNNPRLEQFVLPPKLTFADDKVPIIMEINPLIAAVDLIQIQEMCPVCRVMNDVACGLDVSKRKYSSTEIAIACSGKAVVKPPPGQTLLFDSAVITEQQMNAMCASAIYIEGCIMIKKSFYKGLHCPYLQTLKACQEGRSAIDIIDNADFESFEIAEGCSLPTEGVPIHLTMNPILPSALLDSIGKKCPTCEVTSDIACGLGNREYTFAELVDACEGKAVIKPQANYRIIAQSLSGATEQQINRLCSKAVYMEICINITSSDITSLNCPRLQKLVSCQPGVPAITIVDNHVFHHLNLPMLVNVRDVSSPLLISRNPRLNPSYWERLRWLCSSCIFNQ